MHRYTRWTVSRLISEDVEDDGDGDGDGDDDDDDDDDVGEVNHFANGAFRKAWHHDISHISPVWGSLGILHPKHL